MWIFKVTYHNMETGKEIIRTIKFDGDNFLSEKECYVYAMEEAYDITQKNECLSTLEFVEC